MKRFIIAILISTSSLLAKADQSRGATNSVPNQMPPMGVADYSHSLYAGLAIGQPTGASMEYFLSHKLAVDAAAGYALGPNNDAEVHADILWNNFSLFPVNGGLPVYAGAGLTERFRHHGDNQTGVRIPFGIAYMLPSAPLQFYAEVGPEIIFTPHGSVDLTGGVGIRYRFW